MATSLAVYTQSRIDAWFNRFNLSATKTSTSLPALRRLIKTYRCFKFKYKQDRFLKGILIFLLLSSLLSILSLQSEHSQNTRSPRLPCCCCCCCLSYGCRLASSSSRTRDFPDAADGMKFPSSIIFLPSSSLSNKHSTDHPMPARLPGMCLLRLRGCKSSRIIRLRPFFSEAVDLSGYEFHAVSNASICCSSLSDPSPAEMIFMRQLPSPVWPDDLYAEWGLMTVAISG